MKWSPFTLLLVLLTSSFAMAGPKEIKCFESLESLTSATKFSKRFGQVNPLGLWKKEFDPAQSGGLVSSTLRLFNNPRNDTFQMVNTVEFEKGSFTDTRQIVFCFTDVRTFLALKKDGKVRDYVEYFRPDSKSLSLAEDEYHPDRDEPQSKFDFFTYQEAIVVLK